MGGFDGRGTILERNLFIPLLSAQGKIAIRQPELLLHQLEQFSIRVLELVGITPFKN